MFRPVLAPPIRHQQRWRESSARLIAPLTLWICVTLSLKYGYYGDCRMVLGPSSSRLMKASSVFVKQIEVRDDDKKGVLLYGFSEMPELSFETNWSVSNFLIIGSYGRKGFSLWLNKGSRIHMRLEIQSKSSNQFQVVMVKGKAAKYSIEEDDRYYIGVINMNHKSILMTMTVNVTSKMYDLTKAKNVCSTLKGSCRLQLLFPNTHYVILTTPSNGDLDGWYIELSFVARVLTYIAILGFIIIIIFLVLKYLGACDGEDSLVDSATREVSETDPIIPEKTVQHTYGTNEEDDDSGSSSSSSEDLYDAKLCVICYDDQRNCFFVPCGHCATCYNCAQRIMEEDSKMCPICRRLIHKIRRLFSP
ncbi:E3 ubiquitin-protein ligase APD2-like isoform X2 [Mangifera indica]|uniref:E3 ubiquitin-protein ligase APD2-like isoform X2 n=1 Tax=Mangifera indica TaxID=29780 RepID=UPI001CFBB81D|nr:E3 ubiquitin-protein ligase APD2-like isoform X2 [Mangifera indica]